jgi:diguanylate cyclase (GGDEF)-like protein
MERRIKISLAGKIAGFVIVIIVIIMSLVVGITLKREEGTATDQMIKRAKDITNALATTSTTAILSNDYITLTQIVKGIGKKGDDIDYVIILNDIGEVMAHTNKSLVGKTLKDDLSLKAQGARTTLSQITEEGVYDVAVPILLGKRRIGLVRVGFSSLPLKARIVEIRDRIFLLTIGLLILGIVISLFLAASITRPINRLVQAAKKIGKGDLGVRVKIASRDEVGELGEVFNEMSKRLSGSFRSLEEKSTLLSRAKEELDQRVLDLQMLQRLSTKISSNLEKEELLRLIVELFMEVAQVEKGSLMLWHEKKKRLYIAYGRGISEEARKRLRLKSGEGIAGQVFEKKKSIIINDTLKNRSYKPLETKTKLHKTETLLALPLVAKGEGVGVITLSNKVSRQPFIRRDEELLSTLASHAAIAIQNAMLYEQAIHDGLTGLYAHTFFQNYLKQEIMKARRYETPLSLLMLDIDYFKRFNDTYGHPAGDMVLVNIARLLQQAIRGADIAARYGGEEFALILPETDAKGAYLLAERLRKKVEDFDFLKGKKKKVKITVSIGVADYRKGLRKEVLIGQADQTLYRAKREGRNKVCLFKSK